MPPRFLRQQTYVHAPWEVPDMNATTNNAPSTTRERISCRGNELVGRVRELVHEGNVRRVRIRHDDHEVMSFPVTVGVVGTLLAPWLAAVGAVAALLGRCEIEVERDGDSAVDAPETNVPAGG
jgi:Domain of unknown function (DUF4342)